MRRAPIHQAQVFGSPWQGVHGTLIASARHYGRHWHATYGFGLLEDGAQSSASGRGPVDAYAGDLITTNPGEVHDGRPLGSSSRRWRMLYLEPEVMAAMAGAASAGDVQLTRPVIKDPALAQVLQRLFARLDDWNAGRRTTGPDMLACEEALVHTCGLLMLRHATASPVDERGGNLRVVRERLADERLEAPTLATLASMAGLSRYQLLRRFQQAYGVPPHAWLLQQRVERVRGLIRGGSRLADAAAACGFADQSHMTRVFVRHFGFTPGAWQQATAGMRRP